MHIFIYGYFCINEQSNLVGPIGKKKLWSQQILGKLGKVSRLFIIYSMGTTSLVSMHLVACTSIKVHEDMI